MKTSPLLDQSECANAQSALQYLTIVDANGGLIATILRVEVWWRMIIVVHRNDDAEKTA
jgi:hypothetical protein